MKYSFTAIFKGLGKKPTAKTFTAPSNNKAHKIRAQIVKADVSFVGPIRPHPNKEMPLIVTLGDFDSISRFGGKRKDASS